MAKPMTQGTEWKLILLFALPLVAGNILQQLYNAVDGMVVGNFAANGENALAAVGTSGPVTFVFLAFAIGMSGGCSVIISQLYGARRYDEMRQAVSTSLILVGGIGLFLTVVGGVVAKWFLMHVLSVPDSFLADAVAYLTIYCVGLVFQFVYNIVSFVLRSLGDSSATLYFLLISSVVNIVLDLIFVAVFHWDVAGVAWATFICQGISCILAVLFVFRRFSKIGTEGKIPVFSLKLLKDISVIAVPSILQQSFISVGNIIIQGIINGFGPGVMAGYAASVKLNNLVITSLTTLGNGISNFTSQNLGAKKNERIKEGFLAGVKLVWLICIPLVILYLFAGKYLVYLFLDTPSEAALETGIVFLRILSPFYFVVALKLVSDGVLRGAAMMKKFMVATFTDLILRVLLAWLLSIPFASTGIWLAWPIGWTIAAVMSYFFYRSHKWDAK